MRPYILTLAYCPAEVLATTLEQMKRTCVLGLHHYIVDHHWPIDHDNNSVRLRILAQQHGCTVLSPLANLGTNRGFLWAYDQLKDEGPLAIVVDGDAYPLTRGWDEALLDVMEDHSVGCACLDVSEGYARYSKGHTKCQVRGRRCTEYDNAESTDIVACHVKYAIAAFEKCKDRWYAGTGAYDELKADGKRQVYLDDFKQRHPHPVPLPDVYWEWKRYANGGGQLNFDKWLSAKLMEVYG